MRDPLRMLKSSSMILYMGKVQGPDSHYCIRRNGIRYTIFRRITDTILTDTIAKTWSLKGVIILWRIK